MTGELRDLYDGLKDKYVFDHGKQKFVDPAIEKFVAPSDNTVQLGAGHKSDDVVDPQV